MVRDATEHSRVEWQRSERVVAQRRGAAQAAVVAKVEVLKTTCQLAGEKEHQGNNEGGVAVEAAEEALIEARCREAWPHRAQPWLSGGGALWVPNSLHGFRALLGRRGHRYMRVVPSAAASAVASFQEHQSPNSQEEVCKT